jgi:DNA-binding transcriptional regulator YdaS (Cro superfamily)
MTLREYRRKAGLTLEQMALLLGRIHFTTVQKWEVGIRVPDAIQVALIERVTKGKVRASSFKRRPEAPPVARKRRPRGARTMTAGEQDRGRAHG